MSKQEKIKKYITEAQNFIGHGLTASDSRFKAWNNGLLRFIRNNYDKETYDGFKGRYYSLHICTLNTPESRFIEAFEQDMVYTIEDLKQLLEEENDDNITNDNITVQDNDNLQLIIGLFTRFHLVCRQLKRRYDLRNTLIINDEYDVQDLIHALLCIYFDDIRTEEWTPSYAGKCSRQDFLIKKEQIVIEIKKTRKGLQDKQIGEQLINDIERYKSHPDCKTLLCFVYDPDELISNPKGLENDLTKTTDGLNVITIITQK